MLKDHIKMRLIFSPVGFVKTKLVMRATPKTPLSKICIGSNGDMNVTSIATVSKSSSGTALRRVKCLSRATILDVNDLLLSDYRALAEFRYQIRKFLAFSEGQARAHGLEPQQHQLLLAVRGIPQKKQATIGELAGRLGLRHHSTVELVNRLEALGAVARIQSEQDRRQVIVQLTRTGTVLLRKLSLAHRHELETAGPELARALRAVMRSNRNHAHSA
jgi:DNA-binding MarR family transcriptional regulator